MNIPDLANGCFEGVAGFMLWFNSRKLYKDKQLKGVHIFPTAFFALWGYWNLFYYPHLNQWVSFAMGINVVLANTVWVALAIYYKKKEKRNNA